jgi:hypothetical protein
MRMAADTLDHNPVADAGEDCTNLAVTPLFGF